jgi:FkbM family methyltransferase
MIRRWAEILLASVELKRRLPKEVGGGELFASASGGGMKYLFRRSKNLDAKLLNIATLLVREHSTVWDVGANVGLFSVSAAGIAGPSGSVFAIEADINMAQLLLRTSRLKANQRLAPISVIPVAISNQTAILKFNIARRSRASNSLEGYGASQMGGVVDRRLVPALSLDELRLSLPAPLVLKVDVEGAELAVFAGAENVLTKDRPFIYCEVGSEHSEDVMRHLKRVDYMVFDGATVDRTFSSPEPLSAPWDTLAIPREKLISLKRPTPS